MGSCFSWMYTSVYPSKVSWSFATWKWFHPKRSNKFCSLMVFKWSQSWHTSMSVQDNLKETILQKLGPQMQATVSLRLVVYLSWSSQMWGNKKWWATVGNMAACHPEGTQFQPTGCHVVWTLYYQISSFFSKTQKSGFLCEFRIKC